MSDKEFRKIRQRFESEELFRKVFEEGPLGMALFGPDYRFIKVNADLCRMLGYTEKELVKLAFVDITHPDDIAIDAQSAKKVFSGAISDYTIYKRCIKKNKKIFRITLTASAIHDKSGKLLYGLALIKDISEQKRDENELRKLNTELEQRITERTEHIKAINREVQLLSDLLMRSSQPFGVGYPDGSFGLHNPALRELIGYGKEEMKIIKWSDITPPEWLEQEAKILEELERTGNPAYYEKEYIRKDGSRVPVELLVHRINDESGKLLYYYAFIKDITLQKQKEIELKQREKDLEIKTQNIEEANIALKILLKRRDDDRRELEERVLLNIRELVHPYMEKLKMSGLDEKQMTYASILESNLNELISPFSHTLTSMFSGFTPKEIQIANLLRQGKTNKEIGRLLNSSPRTIAFHRENIRKKIGLKNMKVNLKSYLLSLP